MSTASIIRARFKVAALLGAVVLASPSPGFAAKLSVEGYGVDGPHCGTKTEPCPSISHAIGLAVDGDQVVVGPGRYGDFYADGVFEPVEGEEAGEPGAGRFCTRPRRPR